MKYYQSLTLPVQTVREDFVFPQLNTDYDFSIYPMRDIKKILTKEFITLLHDISFGYPMIYMFSTLPHKKGPVHIDGIKYDENKAALNIVLGSNDHMMYWYEQHELLSTVKDSLIGSPVIYIPANTVTRVAGYQISQPTIIRNGIPHNIQNNDDTPRWCLSIRNKLDMTFTDIQNMFSLWQNND